MKKIISMLFFLISFDCYGTVIFMNDATLSAFNVAFFDYKKNETERYSVFIEEKDRIVLISFIENGMGNSNGRPVAYGKGVKYEIEKNTNLILKKVNTFDK